MSWASEVRGHTAWYSNSYRFETRDEAEHFIGDLRETWVPREFVRATRVLFSEQPVNSRWDYEANDAIRIFEA